MENAGENGNAETAWYTGNVAEQIVKVIKENKSGYPKVRWRSREVYP